MHKIGFARRTDFQRVFSDQWSPQSASLSVRYSATATSLYPEHLSSQMRAEFVLCPMTIPISTRWPQSRLQLAVMSTSPAKTYWEMLSCSQSMNCIVRLACPAPVRYGSHIKEPEANP